MIIRRTAIGFRRETLPPGSWLPYTARMCISWCSDIPRFGDADQYSKWLKEQHDKCNDEAFGQRFAASCPVPGLMAEAYQHRRFEVGGETLLAGIRFKGGDLAQPFVDLLAWTGAPSPQWIPATTREFSSFNPLAVRFCWSQDTEPPWPGEVDQYVYAGRARGAVHQWIMPARDCSWFDDFRRRFDEWQNTSRLGTEVRPAEADEFKACLDDGHVVVASCDGTFLGVAACRRQSERAFVGWSIVEEFVVPQAQGRGLGTALQRGLMQCLPADELVWGTIHHKNMPSRKTAARCGRQAVETWWFTPCVIA